jgi:hypothetical protein
MKRVSILLSLLLLLSMLMFSLKITYVKAEPRTWTVDDDGPADFHTIREAVDTASSGDTIYVKAGAYWESELLRIIGKSLYLIGENQSTTIINAGIDLTDIHSFLLTGFTIDAYVNDHYHSWAYALDIYRCENVSIINNVILENGMHAVDNDLPSVVLIDSNNCTVKDNIIAGYGVWALVGIYVEGEGHLICGNVVGPGLLCRLDIGGHNSIICCNNFSDVKIRAYGSSDRLFHNNFFGYEGQFLPSIITWDDDYPSGGNYYDDYTGADAYHGPNQNIIGSDGIGDTPHFIDAENIDHYPLMNPWTPTETTITVKGKSYPVTIVSNTTLEQIVATSNTLHFKSSGPTGETGYCNVIFPMVNTTDIKVFIDGRKLTPPPFPIVNSNGTHYFIYFEFTLSTHDMTIQFAPSEVPVGGEWVPISKLQLLASWIGLISLMTILTTSFVYIRRKRRQN